MPVSYYNAPEGQDLTGKLSYALSRSTLVGIACGIVDAKLFSNPQGFKPTFGRLFYWTWPIVGMSTTFVATTYIATNIRQKDDIWNYALGGAAAGTIFGTWRRSGNLGLVASVSFAVAAILKKKAVDNNFVFFPDTRQGHQTVGSKNYDFTLAPYIPGNWTTGRND